MFSPQMLCLGVLVLLASTATGATRYSITLNTSQLVGHPAGPFVLNFQLTDGSGLGNGNNIVTLGGFSFGMGGGPTGLPDFVGGASGELASGVALADTSFLNTFSQTFEAGDVLRFVLALSTEVELGPQPDQFSFSILDNSGFEIPYKGIFNAALVIDIVSPRLTPLAFSTDSSMSPLGGGGPIEMAAPVLISSVPEPSSLTLVWTSLSLIIIAARIQRRTKK